MFKRNLLFIAVILALLSGFRVQSEAAFGATIKDTALSAVTTGTSSVFNLDSYDRVGLAVVWATGVTAGVVTLETAATSSASGTWQDTISLSVPASPPATTSEAVDICAHWARVRVSTTISGGGSPSVTAYIFRRKVGGQ